MEHGFYEQINALPMELQYEILKHKPYYRRINQELHQDTKTYNDRFWNQPISYKEFVKSLTDTPSYIFTPYPNGFYLIQFSIRVNIYDFKLIHDSVIVLTDHMSFEYFDPYFYITDDTYYDMMSTYLILQNRDCDPTTSQFMKDINQFKDIPTQDVKSYFYNLEKYLYFKTGVGSHMTDKLANDMTCDDFENLIRKTYYHGGHQKYDITNDQLLSVLEQNYI